MVKLLKFIDGDFQVVDYGVKEKAELYASQGYLVQHI
jgi:hypothetical protein